MPDSIEHREAFHGEEVNLAYERFLSSYQHMELLSNQACEAMVASIAQMPFEELILNHNLRKLLGYGGMLSIKGNARLVPSDEKMIRNALNARLSELFVNDDGSNLFRFDDTRIGTAEPELPKFIITVPTEKDLDALPDHLMKFLHKLTKLIDLLHGEHMVVALRVHDDPSYRSGKTIALP